MKRINLLIVISILILLTVATDTVLQIQAASKLNADIITVVYAARDVPGGKVIGFDDVFETRVLRSRLPKGIKSDVLEPNHYCPSSKIDVVGRTSVGIRSLEIIVHKYPGFKSMLLLEP